MAMSDHDRLSQLFRARHPCIKIVTHEEDYALVVVRETAVNLGLDVRMWSIVGGVRDGLLSDQPAIPETEPPAGALYHLKQVLRAPCVMVLLDMAGHLKDERTLRLFRNLVTAAHKHESIVVMVDHTDAAPNVVNAEATAFEVSLPDRAELEQIIRETLQIMRLNERIHVKLTRRELNTIVRNLSGLTRRQAEQIVVDCVADDHTFDAEDINTILSRKRQMLAGAGLLEYVEAPVDLSEIGGLRNLKRWLKVRGDALSDEAASLGLTAPRGVLMLGVQGAGKSLCAKAIATAWHRPLLRMDVGALYDQYIGQSERRLRDTLRQAEAMAPMVLWIDEIEKAFASAASRSSDGGLSQRMFGTLLTWMQEHAAPVFLVATANDIEALPPELLRKGRFDEIFFVDLPKKATRRRIFEIHLAKRNREPASVDLDALAEASEGFSGAEIEQAIVAAMHEAYASKTALNTDDIVSAMKASPPLSVTMAERVQRLREWAARRCVPAD